MNKFVMVSLLSVSLMNACYFSQEAIEAKYHNWAENMFNEISQAREQLKHRYPSRTYYTQTEYHEEVLTDYEIETLETLKHQLENWVQTSAFFDALVKWAVASEENIAIISKMSDLLPFGYIPADKVAQEQLDCTEKLLMILSAVEDAKLAHLLLYEFRTNEHLKTFLSSSFSIKKEAKSSYIGQCIKVEIAYLFGKYCMEQRAILNCKQ